MSGAARGAAFAGAGANAAACARGGVSQSLAFGAAVGAKRLVQVRACTCAPFFCAQERARCEGVLQRAPRGLAVDVLTKMHSQDRHAFCLHRFAFARFFVGRSICTGDRARARASLDGILLLFCVCWLKYVSNARTVAEEAAARAVTLV